MKFLFLARFSPDVKTVSQTYREKSNQNNERIKVKTLLVEVRTCLNRLDPGEHGELDTNLGHGRAVNSSLRERV